MTKPAPGAIAGGFARFFNRVIDNGTWATLSDPARAVYLPLVRLADTGPNGVLRSRAGVAALVRMSGMSRSSVKRGLKQLQDVGLVVVARTGGITREGANRSNVYDLPVPAPVTQPEAPTTQPEAPTPARDADADVPDGYDAVEWPDDLTRCVGATDGFPPGPVVCDDGAHDGAHDGAGAGPGGTPGSVPARAGDGSGGGPLLTPITQTTSPHGPAGGGGGAAPGEAEAQETEAEGAEACVPACWAPHPDAATEARRLADMRQREQWAAKVSNFVGMVDTGVTRRELPEVFADTPEVRRAVAMLEKWGLSRDEAVLIVVRHGIPAVNRALDDARSLHKSGRLRSPRGYVRWRLSDLDVQPPSDTPRPPTPQASTRENVASAPASQPAAPVDAAPVDAAPVDAAPVDAESDAWVDALDDAEVESLAARVLERYRDEPGMVRLLTNKPIRRSPLMRAELTLLRRGGDGTRPAGRQSPT